MNTEAKKQNRLKLSLISAALGLTFFLTSPTHAEEIAEPTGPSLEQGAQDGPGKRLYKKKKRNARKHRRRAPRAEAVSERLEENGHTRAADRMSQRAQRQRQLSRKNQRQARRLKKVHRRRN